MSMLEIFLMCKLKMFNRDMLLELLKHLDLTDVANLASLNKEMNRLSQHDLIWEKIYSKKFSNEIDYYDTYRDNFQLAWKLLHPKYYSILLIYGDDYYQPLGIFNTRSTDLVVDKIWELYNSGRVPELNKSINMAILRKPPTTKIYELGFEELAASINKRDHTYLALLDIRVYEYPGEPNESSIFCFYYSGEQQFNGYGCFTGNDSREEVIDIIGWLLNETDEFMGRDKIFCREDENEEEKEFKDEFCDKYISQEVENEDIEYLLDHSVEYDEGIFILKALPFYQV